MARTALEAITRSGATIDWFPAVAVMVTSVACVTLRVATRNVADSEAAVTVTEPGTSAAKLFDESWIDKSSVRADTSRTVSCTPPLPITDPGAVSRCEIPPSCRSRGSAGNFQARASVTARVRAWPDAQSSASLPDLVSIREGRTA